MNKRSNFDKSWIKYENFLKFSFHRAQKNLHFVKLGLRKSRWKMPTPPKKGKIPEFWAFSHIFFSSFHDCNDHKRLPQTIGARFYQMDHIWWAPHMHKKLSGPKIESQLRNTFGQSLISTLYVIKITFHKFLKLYSQVYLTHAWQSCTRVDLCEAEYWIFQQVYYLHIWISCLDKVSLQLVLST